MNERRPADEAVDLVAGLLRDGGEGEEPGVFRPEAERALADHLDVDTAENALAEVCERLMIIAFELETEHESPTAAALIARVLERKSLHVRLARARAGRLADDEEARKEALTSAFSGFTETKKVLRAPTTDTSAPEGTLKLKSIHVRRRFQ